MTKIPLKRIGEYLQTAFKIIEENGGSYPIRDILKEVERRIQFNEYEKGSLKSGYIRWQSYLYFYSIDCTKAGWLKKNKGVWYITEEGKNALQKDSESFIKEASDRYWAWKEQIDAKATKNQEDIEEDVVKDKATSYEQALEISRNEIEEYIKNLTPYEFQDLIAALLRGMGYYTPFIAPEGPDGGVDIICYKDPLGAEGVRIKIQVKHRNDYKVNRQEVAALKGVLRNTEIGIIVSIGGFTKDAINEIRSSEKHIEKIDLDDFIGLWEEYYDKLDEEDRTRLPLRKICFIAPEN